jgi:hypothetical protein
MRKLFCIAALCTCLAPAASAQNPDLMLNPGSAYVEIGRSIDWGTQFNRTYVIVPNSPNASLCIYVYNNNPTSTHTFTTAVFQAADSQVQNFSSNIGRYTSVLLNGNLSSVPASTIAAGFVQSTAAAKVAIKFTGAATQAGSPDTADVFLVQTTTGTCGSTNVALSVQGAVADGTLFSANPLVIGGKTSSGSTQSNVAKTLTALGESVNDLNSATYGVVGLAMGAGNINPLNSFTGITLPNVGPLAIALFGPQADNPAGSDRFVGTTASGGAPGVNGSGSAGKSLSGLLINNSGISFLNAKASVASTSTVSVTGPGWNWGTFDSCYVTVISDGGTGTLPTLDVYFQNSTDGLNFSDRIHFATITTSASKQMGGISAGPGGITPVPITSGALAASTKLDGPIGAWLQFQYVVSGTGPNFTNVQAGVVCH